ncbi:UDP-N-acetylmuramoyl-tripeptide--D-alanyl-D-alanine ligase [Candidatus Photodesmus blepharus]|uniref:UDP-N-acetylmuramoyl-tripeptide--D-alanyl-D-alanine ligase n=1 Tax=Candidatus Photodesmus blepharonis TaxID=1179155 RepID=A0A084CMU4_9GAMM|nr:UDP-N-acetylmuramoyl-tripeptide--D-alanyl-D-alanine ligase [Candidatus Photodesmus blepharus]KEY91123.1 UDP-N-acetylmuramoyl-tripeptide--D-alanyl-D-alanine ligase [Candidatus Photodesmus blepharus]
MITVSLKQLSNLLNGYLIGKDLKISDVSTDSRSVVRDALFVALVGKNFDANDFVYQAVGKGAKALLVNKPFNVSVPQLVVRDTTLALGQLGAWVHQNCGMPTVAITGSCGKTTVKEMLVNILLKQGRVLFTIGNFNNEIGVPMTLLRSTPQDDYAVIELGSNHIGEIAYTVSLVQPDIALVNNVGAAHLEGFGSIEGVKCAKGEIYQGLKSGSVAIVNLDSNGGQCWEPFLLDKKVITFSKHNKNADVYASRITLDIDGKAQFCLHTPQGTCDIQLSVVGKHNVSNALAASSLALQFGIDLSEIRCGLLRLVKVKGRVELIKLTEKIKLIDDTYNASVPSMKASVDLLGVFEGLRWLILGNMTELGSESLTLHRQVGEYAASFNFEYVLTYGSDVKLISDICHGLHFDTYGNMVTYIKHKIEKHNDKRHTLLFKGANSVEMNKLVLLLRRSINAHLAF